MLAHLMSAQGPLTRSVADARLALAAMSMRDPRDPWWVPAPLEGSKPKAPIRVALAKIPADMKVDPSVRGALTQAADAHEGGFAEVQVDPMLQPLASCEAFHSMLTRRGLQWIER